MQDQAKIDALTNFREDALSSFRGYKKLAERAIEQVSDDEFVRTLGEEDNSIAVIVKHIAGNARSRWRDFLSTDGEKPDRDRDLEFELVNNSREQLMAAWDEAWQILFDNIGPLSNEDLSRTVTIRSEPHTVIEAINRQLTHYAYHIGQIVLLAKHFRGREWKTLSVARNRSQAFNQYLADRQTKGEAKIDRFEAAGELINKSPEN